MAVKGKKNKKSPTHKAWVWASGTVLAGAVGWAVADLAPEIPRPTASPQQAQPVPEQHDTSSNPKKIDTLTVVAVGDIMLGTWFPNRGFLPPEGPAALLEPVKGFLGNHDVLFGNLEGALLDGEGKVKTCSNPAICYAFKSPESYADVLAQAGFDVVSVANNHVGDFGPQGRAATLAALKAAGLAHAGVVEVPSTVFERKGIKVGFAAFAPNQGTMSVNDLDGAAQIVAHLSQESDVVLVSMHIGAEGKNSRHVTGASEPYLGENRGNPHAFARRVIDAGADLVLGHGPHVTRALDLYKGRLIVYSLGNFATYGRFNLKGSAGVAPVLRAQIDHEGRFLGAEIHSIRQSKPGGPRPDPAQRAWKEIVELSQEDAPNSGLRFVDSKVRPPQK